MTGVVSVRIALAVCCRYLSSFRSALRCSIHWLKTVIPTRSLTLATHTRLSCEVAVIQSLVAVTFCTRLATCCYCCCCCCLLSNSDNDDNSKLLICHLLLCHSVSPFGVMVTVLDLQFKGCGFDSWPFCCQVMILGKLITHMPLPPSSRNWYQSNTGGALWLGQVYLTNARCARVYMTNARCAQTAHVHMTNARCARV